MIVLILYSVNTILHTYISVNLSTYFYLFRDFTIFNFTNVSY